MMKKLWQNKYVKNIIYLLILLIIIYTFRSMLNLFLLILIITYFMNTIVSFIMKRLSKYFKPKYKLVTGVTYLLVVSLLVFFSIRYIPVVANQSINIVNELSRSNFTHNKYVEMAMKQVNIEKYLQMGVGTIVEGATNVGRWLFDIFMAFTLSLFFLLQKKEIFGFMEKFKYSKISSFYNYVAYISKKFFYSFGTVIQAQIIVAFVNTVLSFIGLYIIGFKSLIALSIMIFVLSLIPVAGVIISMIPLCLMAFNMGGIIKVLYVIIMIAIIHAFESYVLNPKLMSNKTNLPIFFTFITLLVSEHFMGVWGLLLGIPIVMFILDLLDVDLSDKTHK